MESFAVCSRAGRLSEGEDSAGAGGWGLPALSPAVPPAPAYPKWASLRFLFLFLFLGLVASRRPKAKTLNYKGQLRDLKLKGLQELSR